jgi:hypothetical protein
MGIRCGWKCSMLTTENGLGWKKRKNSFSIVSDLNRTSIIFWGC